MTSPSSIVVSIFACLALYAHMSTFSGSLSMLQEEDILSVLFIPNVVYVGLLREH